MKKIKYISLCILLAICSMVTPISANSVSPGSSFNISVSCGNIEGSVYASGSNASVTSNDNWCDRGRSVSASAIAGGEGTASVSFYTNVAADIDSGDLPRDTLIGSGSVTVYVQQSNGGSSGGGNTGGGNTGGGNTGNNNGGSNTNTPNVDNNGDEEENDKSADNNLASLNVSKGTLDPLFSADITNYKVSLPSDTTTITIDATATDEKATVENTGEHSLNIGDNEIGIAVTAENGTVKTYVINAYVDETPITFMKYMEEQLGVVRNVDDVTISENFEKMSIQFDGQEIPAWKHKELNLTLVYLINENGDKNFYIYEEGKGIVSIYKPITLFDIEYAIIDIPDEMKERSGLIFQDVEIEQIQMPGWIYKDSAFEQFTLIYLMDSKGEKKLYQYDKEMNNLQCSVGAAITQDAYDKLLSDQKQNTMIQMIIIGALIVTNIITILTLLFSIRRNKRRMKLQMHQTNLQQDTYIDDEDSEDYDMPTTRDAFDHYENEYRTDTYHQGYDRDRGIDEENNR